MVETRDNCKVVATFADEVMVRLVAFGQAIVVVTSEGVFILEDDVLKPLELETPDDQ